MGASSRNNFYGNTCMTITLFRFRRFYSNVKVYLLNTSLHGD